MTSEIGEYARYVLRNLIDSLEQPYDAPVFAESGLLYLSDGLAEGSDAIPHADLERLRGEDLSATGSTTLVGGMIDRLLRTEGLGTLEPDLLHALLLLQRRDPALQRRVIRFLRCEPLSAYEQRLLGGLGTAHRARRPVAHDPPARHDRVRAPARVARAAGRSGRGHRARWAHRDPAAAGDRRAAGDRGLGAVGGGRDGVPRRRLHGGTRTAVALARRSDRARSAADPARDPAPARGDRGDAGAPARSPVLDFRRRAAGRRRAVPVHRRSDRRGHAVSRARRDREVRRVSRGVRRGRRAGIGAKPRQADCLRQPAGDHRPRPAVERRSRGRGWCPRGRCRDPRAGRRCDPRRRTGARPRPRDRSRCHVADGREQGARQARARGVQRCRPGRPALEPAVGAARIRRHRRRADRAAQLGLPVQAEDQDLASRSASSSPRADAPS